MEKKVALKNYQIDDLTKEAIYKMYREDKITLTECSRLIDKIDQGESWGWLIPYLLVLISLVLLYFVLR